MVAWNLNFIRSNTAHDIFKLEKEVPMYSDVWTEFWHFFVNSMASLPHDAFKSEKYWSPRVAAGPAMITTVLRVNGYV